MTQRSAVRADHDAALATIAGQKSAMIERLTQWCAINTGSHNLEGLARFSETVANVFAAELGVDVDMIEPAAHAVVGADGAVHDRRVGPCLRIVQRPQAPVRALLVGHMDTVFASDHPFQASRFIGDDKMNAPGCADMKGGLLVMLHALKAVEASSFRDALGYEIILNSDEEIGSPGSAPILAAAAARAHFGCVYEPALPDGTLAGARKGSGNFSAVFRGRSAHAGRNPEDGRNAVVAAAHFSAAIDALTGACDGLTVNVAKIEGGGPNNVVPDTAVVRFNTRVSRPEDAMWFAKRAEELLADATKREGLTGLLHGGFNRPPKPTTPEIDAFFSSIQAIGAELGLSIRWRPSGGVCDGNNIAAVGVPVIDTLGVRGGDIHSAHEYVLLDSLEERAKLSALLLLRIAAGEIPNPGAHGRGGSL